MNNRTFEEIAVRISNNLRAARIHSGLSILEVSEQTGHSRSQIYAYENPQKNRTPTISILNSFAFIYVLDITHFFKNEADFLNILAYNSIDEADSYAEDIDKDAEAHYSFL